MAEPRSSAKQTVKNNSNNLILGGFSMRNLVASLMAVGLLTACAQAGAQDYFTETSKDFGTTPRGPMLVHYFSIKNTSPNTITLGQPRVSCGCVSAALLKGTLAPGETTHLVAYMDSRRIPQANVVKTVIVFVPFLSPVLEEVQVKVSAIARDDLVMSPETLAFGTVRKGQGGKATTKLTFYSDPSWKITGVYSTGIYVKAEAKPAAKVGRESTYEITATLDPECPVGNWVADVWVQTATPGLEKVRIPVTVNVISPIMVNPELIRFDNAKVGDDAEQKVILQGNQPFKITGHASKSKDLELSSIGEGARPVHILKVTWKASQPGDLTSTIEVTTDHPQQKTVTIPVSGKATAK